MAASITVPAAVLLALALPGGAAATTSAAGGEALADGRSDSSPSSLVGEGRGGGSGGCGTQLPYSPTPAQEGRPASGLVCNRFAAEEVSIGPPVPYEVVSRYGIPPAIPKPLSGKPGDPRRGERVVIDRLLGNCLSCHEVSALREEPFHGEIGPSLDGVGGRWDAATLRMIVVNPKRVFGDDTVMPAFYRTEGLNRVRPEFAGKPILTAQQVEDVVAYLAAMK
jgi:sulfur-oxidizing protein SoxX